MSNASDFIIENGVLTKYVGPGGDVAIPEGVTALGNVFCGEAYISPPHLLTSIILPESITEKAIHAPTGSYAEQYAKENNIPFVAE